MKNIFYYLSFALFLLFAYFQINDPDPTRWMPIYLIPAFISLKQVFKPSHVQFLIGLSFGYFLMASLQWPPEFEGFLFGEMKMRSLNIELARESGGLAIVSLFLFIFSKIK